MLQGRSRWRGLEKKEMPITCGADTNTANGECVEVWMQERGMRLIHASNSREWLLESGECVMFLYF